MVSAVFEALPVDTAVLPIVALGASATGALPASASASVNVTTSTRFDVRGLAASITDPRGKNTTCARDAAGRLTGETDALHRTTSTRFDALGRPVKVTAADGSVTSTSYTADSDAAKVTYPDRAVTSTFDAVGNRVTMKDNLGTSSWVYDWSGRVTSETDARGSPIHYIAVADSRDAMYFSLGSDWTSINGPVNNNAAIQLAIEAQMPVRSTVSVTELWVIRARQAAAGQDPIGNSLLTEWQALEDAKYFWADAHTLMPPGSKP